MSQLSQTANMLGQLAGLFGQHTTAYKTLAIAQTWIETYKSIAALYSPPPVGVGPVLSPFMTGAVLAMGALQTANIAKQDTSMKGYAAGGRLPAGKAGIIEGTHNEIIAPEEDFKTVVRDLYGEGVRHALIDLKMSGGLSATSIQDLREIKAELTGLKSTISNLDKSIGNGIAAYLDDKQAKKIYNRGSAINRRGKL
jgi:hypothetical protein